MICQTKPKFELRPEFDESNPYMKLKEIRFCLFDLIFYIPGNNFSIMLGLVFLGLTSTEQELKEIR